jgi:hypothetical protein
MKKVYNLYDIQDGDVLFKNTEMDDKGKNFFMRIVNEITTGWQNFKRWLKGMPPMSGRDHTEFLLWNGNVLETHSSVSGVGLRTMNFVRWMEREGYPKIEILRPPKRMSQDDIEITRRQIINDRGIPYALKPAIKEGLSMEVNSESNIDLMKRGLFCSESTKRWAGYRPFTGQWPDELYIFFQGKNYLRVYKGESKDLIS